MSNPTTPFSWQMPTATDLVTDLPADFEVFGQAVATSMADLLGGTSGQVLAKNSNTDMDFVWVTSDDANAIQNAIVDAKGDLIAATAADTPARLASSGVNGNVLTVDTTAATGLAWAAPAGLTYSAWTPTTTGITLGNGTLTARYVQSGKFVTGSINVTLGSTSSISAAGISFTAPVTLKASDNSNNYCLLYDVSLEAILGIVVTDTTKFYLGCAKSSTSFVEYASINSTQPFTWTTNDKIILNFSYEAA
jgi:hypothetical protein